MSEIVIFNYKDPRIQFSDYRSQIDEIFFEASTKKEFKDTQENTYSKRIEREIGELLKVPSSFCVSQRRAVRKAELTSGRLTKTNREPG